MAKYWQTNSTGTVVEIAGASGKWLTLVGNASYQIDTLLQLPKKFTLEFDLLTRTSEARDLKNITFGFSKNNHTHNYIYGVSKDNVIYTQLMYYYEAISTKSHFNNNSSRIEYPLSNYANATMHIAMAVDGDRIQIYIDNNKILDTVAIDPS